MANTAMTFLLVSVCFHKYHLSETNRFNHLFISCKEFKIISEKRHEELWLSLIGLIVYMYYVFKLSQNLF